jgi:hypothetical protein
MKLMTDRVRIQADDIPDLAFGNAADLVIGALTASFGNPDEDNGWQVSAGEWGVCVGDLERVVRFGPFAAIVTMVDDADVFNGYRQDVGFGDLGSPASQLETLSGLRAGDTVGDLATRLEICSGSTPTRPSSSAPMPALARYSNCEGPSPMT